MIALWHHPGFRALNRYIDGELDERRRAHVAGHITGCRDCRETVERLRMLGDAARALGRPPLPKDLLERVLERRAAGERIILHTAVPGRPRPLHAVAIRAAAIGGAILTVGALALLVPEVEAGATELSIAPAGPRAGAEVAFEYRDAGVFGDLDHLVLRTRYRTTERDHQLTAGYLDLDADGRYHGRVTLPDSVVYAVFVVEDPAGMNVDSNRGRYWEVLERGSDGEPTFDALMARAQDLFGRDWEAGLDAARDAVARFPNRPAGWALLLSRERQILEDSAVVARHRIEFERLDALFDADAHPEPADVAALAYYAFALGDMKRADYWAQRAMATPAKVPPVYRASMVSILEKRAGDRLERLDALWRAFGPELALARHGWEIAGRGNDDEAIRTWYERTRDLQPDAALQMASALLARPALRHYGIAEVRTQLDLYANPPGEERALFRTVPQEQRYRMREVASARARFGNALIEDGQIVAGMEQLRLAASGTWSPVILEEIAESLLRHGDTAGARTALLRLAADPSYPADRLRRSTDRLGPATRTAAWDQDIQRTRVSMERELFADAFIRYVSGEVPLEDANGVRRDLSDLTRGSVAVVVHWSWRCPYALGDVPAINGLVRSLEEHGIPVVVVASDANSPGLHAALQQSGARFDVYADVRARVEAEFGSGATPEYYVLDERGRIRFFRSEPEMVAQHAILLRTRSTTVVAAREP